MAFEHHNTGCEKVDPTKPHTLTICGSVQKSPQLGAVIYESATL